MQETPETDRQASTFSMFADQNWFSDLERSSAWIRIYTAFDFDFSAFNRFAKSVPRLVHIDAPISVTPAIIHDATLKVATADLHNARDGMPTIHINTHDLVLKESTYVILAVALDIDGQKGDPVLAISRLDRCCALLRLHYGWNLLFELVAEGQVKMSTGQFYVSNRAKRLPDGMRIPMSDSQTREAFSETLEAINRAPIETRQRLLLALQFAQKSFSDDEAFFYSWTAMEIMYGKTDAIRHALMSLCGLTKKQEVDALLGFKQIAKWRHDYMHHGRAPPFHADVERFIRVMTLELLRWKVHLPGLGLLEVMRNAVGCDLSPIGLADRRTEEQKQSADRLR